MPILIVQPVRETIIFAVIFLAALFIFINKRKDRGGLTLGATAELKGLAILMVIFCHVGYFLSADTRFLFPFSTLAGVGVNLFLFLSGFGLATSTCQRGLTALQCYRRRLIRLFVPLWLTLAVIVILDFALLTRVWPLSAMIQSLVGFFPAAGIYDSLNSPLWYFTLILFYYLIFPLLFGKRHPVISAVLILLASYFLLTFNLPILPDVIKLYRLHLWAFPLGVAFAGWLLRPGFWQKLFPTKLAQFFAALDRLGRFRRWALISGLIFAAGYLGLHSGVGESIGKEQLISLLTVGALIGIFMLKKMEFRLLYFFGLYSYEIYLLHWPLLLRHDFLYKFLPGSIATIIYLGVFLALGFGLKKAAEIILKKSGISGR